MNFAAILLTVLALVLVGVLPTWPYSRDWGYLPSVGAGLLMVVVVVLQLMGRM